MISSFTIAGSGESDLVRDRSAPSLTVVVALAELFDVVVSAASELMLAWFVIPQAAWGVTLISTLAFAPFASDPRLQVTVPLACEQLP